MSHHLYDPFDTENQSTTQGQYGLHSQQAEIEPRRGTSRLGPGSSFSSSGTSSVIPNNSGGMLPSLMSQSMSYRPEQGRTIMDVDIERSIDMHISRAREESRVPSNPVQRPIDQDMRFTSTQRDEFRSSSTGMTSYPIPSASASLGHRHSDVESSRGSMNWSNYKRPTADDSTFYSSSASSNYAGGSDGRFHAPSEREREMQPIPGLGGYDYPGPDKSVAPTESSRPKYTSQSAANILMHFGLEKEDLEHLISYPEDQITPANLPFILRQIRIEKSKKPTSAGQSKPYPDPQPTRSVGQMDSHSLSTSGGSGIRKEEISSAVLQPSKVIDYGHTGKYTGGVGDEIGKTGGSRANSVGSGGMLMMDNYDTARHSQEPLPKMTTEVKSSSLGSSRQQAGSVPSTNFSYTSILKSVAPPIHDHTTRLQTGPNQTSQTIPSSFSLPNKDTDIRVLKTEASKPGPSKEPTLDRQSTSKTQPPINLLRGVHPSRTGLVLFDSNNKSGTKDQSKTRGQGSTVAEQMKKQQLQKQPIQQKPPVEQQPKHQMHQAQKQPVGQVMWPPVFSAAKSIPSAAVIANIPDAPRAMQHSMFIPGAPRPIIIPPVLPQLIPPLMTFNQMMLTASNQKPSTKVAVSKGRPTPAMMHDYAAASPKIFPHTCSLCNKECTHMKDWISHQNTSLHLENCTLLRTRYPEWDGEIITGPRTAGKDNKASTSAPTSQQRHQRSRHESSSRSRSSSPRHKRGSERRREKRSSRSQSPRAFRNTRRSRSRSRDRPAASRHRSRSRSPERRSSPRRRDEKRSSPRRSRERRSSPRRSDDRRSPPRRRDDRRSPPRRSDEKRSPPRKSRDSRSPPRKSRDSRSPPRKSRDSRSPPRKSRDSRSPTRKSRDSRSPTRKSRSSTEGSSPQQRKSSIAERLAKNLLETSAVQSLSKRSDLEAMVKTLTPALLAEIAKLESSSSSTAKKESTTNPSKAKPSLQKGKSGKSSAPTMVRLDGVDKSLSHSDMAARVGQFGKTKSIVMLRAVKQVNVCFEKEEDAKKLKSAKSFKLKGFIITVAGEKETVTKEQKKPPQKKPAMSTTTTKTGKVTSQKIAAKGSVKALTTVTKSKALVSKARTISTKLTNTLKAGKLPVKGAAKKVVVKQKTSSVSKSTGPKNQPVAGHSKQKPVPEKSGTTVKESVVEPKETAEGDKPANKTVTQPSKGKVTEAKVGTSKAEKASTTQKPKTPADKLAAAEGVVKEKLDETATKAVRGRSTSQENKADVQKSKPKESETKVQEAVVVPKETAEGEKSAKKTVTQPTKVKDNITEGKVKVSKAETASTTQNPQTTADKVAAAGGVVKEKAKEASTKAVSVPSKSTAPESRPDLESSKPKESETKVKGDEVVPKDIEKVTVLEPEHQAKPDKANDAMDVEPMQAGETGVEVAEPMEVESAVETQPSEHSVKESSEQGLETKTEDSQMQQQAGGSPVTDEAPTKDSSAPTAPVVSEQPSSTPSSTEVTPLTIGEMVEKHLNTHRIVCLKSQTIFSPRFFKLHKQHVLITRLPKYEDGLYTEEDVAKLLVPYGFQYTDENINIVPQTQMAFIRMPSMESVHNLLTKVKEQKGVVFRGSTTRFSVLGSDIAMAPLGFYKLLMKLMNSPVHDDGTKIIFISNISPSEARQLRETLKKMGSVSNFLPLLNKVYIEFDCDGDADRLGVWYSLLKQSPGHKVHRLKTPNGTTTSQPPRLPENAVPNGEDAVDGATIPLIKFGVPQGSISPFWITMKTSPFLFPTVSPWFIIPDYLTVREEKDIEEASRGSMLPTIMLTGLPEGNYKHEDVAGLIWRYLPKHSLRSLYYNVTVLTLQRRAFVFFADWSACRNFARDHIKNPVSLQGCTLSVHFVLQHMNFESSEEAMYKTLMELSNAGVPDQNSLEERLLCVETSEASVEVIRTVIEAVASIASFVGFLPLANRICIEMADSSGVTQVVEKHNSFSPGSLVWSKVLRFETLKSLKERLQDASEINIEPEPVSVEAEPSNVERQTQLPPPPPSALETSGSVEEPVTTEPSAAASTNVAMEEDVEKPGTEIAADSAVVPEASEEVEKVKGEEETLTTGDVISSSAVSSGNTVPADCSPEPSDTVHKPEEKFAEFSQLNEDIFAALTAAVRQHRLTRESKTQSEEEGTSENNTSCKAEEKPQKTGQDDLTDDVVSSDAYLLDEQNFDLDDFVTVDEVVDEGEVKSSKPHSSPSSSPSTARRERQRSGVSSSGKKTSARSSKDSKNSSSSSKSTKGTSSSDSSTGSPKKSKNSSEPNKSPTKTLSSASVSKPSSSSSSRRSTEIPSSPGPKTQLSKTKPPAKSSSTASSGRSTRSSSAAHDREKITSATTVEASIKTHPEQLREEAKKDSEGALAKSDHTVSAEGSAAKTVESETKIETSEMHPPSQGHGEESSQAQSLEIDVNVNTGKKGKQEGNEDNADKHTEGEDDDCENYQILDSIDQTDKQMDDGDRDGSSESNLAVPEEGQTLREESCQVLDSVNDDKGRARPEDESEMEIDGSFQVLDSVTDDQAATGQEDSHPVQDDGSTVKGLSEEDAGPLVDKSLEKSAVKDAVGKEQQTVDGDNIQAGCKQAERGEGDGKKRNEKGDSKDLENPAVDEPVQDPDNEDTEQETFEILDSIDDQTATEDDSQKLETGIDQMSKEDIGPIEQEDTFQVIDSLEDQPTTTENQPETDNKEKRTRKVEAAARKDGPSRRSGRTNTVSKTEEKEKSPKKQDRAVKKYETRTKLDTAGVPEKDKEVKEEMMYEIVDSVEDEPVQDAATPERSSRRRSARGKTEDRTSSKPTEVSERPVRDEEATYEILDSVEEEIAEEEPAVTTRSTRGRRERTSKKDASHEKTNKEETPTRRRHSPAGQSQERREETPKKEEKASPTKKSGLKEASEDDGTCEILDSVEDEVGKDDRPARGRKGRRGRPKKEVKTAEKVNVTLKKGDRDASEKVAEEEEATYQILDSVEEDTTDDQPPPGHSESLSKKDLSKHDNKQTKSSASLPESTNNEEEEEPMYQIVDSLEEDEEEPAATEVPDMGEKKKSNEEPSTEKGDTPTHGTKASVASGKSMVKEDCLNEVVVKEDPPAAEEESTSRTESKKEDKSPRKSQSDTELPEVENEQKSAEKDDTASTLVNLDEVSEDEEDYPDDTAEEEELRKRQDATREKQITKERETRRTREREERERRSGSSKGGGSSCGRTRRSKERGRENEEKVEVDAKDLVTLDEVGSDEAAEERPPESREREREIAEGELQTLVTLDEFVEEEEEEEDVKAAQTTLETRPLLQEDESVDSFNPETLVTLDEAGGDEEEKPDEEQAEKTSRSAKRKHDDDTEESMNFVTVDEVGEEEEEKETVTTRTRGRPRKRARPTPARKSTRGKKVSAKDSIEEEKEALDVSSPSDKNPSTLSSDVPPEVQTKEEEEEAERQADISAAKELPEDQAPEECVEEGEEEKKGWSRADIKAVSKRRTELVGPEAKRARSESPCVSADFKLPPFKPNNPLGREFVVPKSGYFCNLCSVFYLNESTAKDAHCSSQRHYNNLEKHYQKLEQEPSQSSQGSVSD